MKKKKNQIYEAKYKELEESNRVTKRKYGCCKGGRWFYWRQGDILSMQVGLGRFARGNAALQPSSNTAGIFQDEATLL